ncbi:hypothetical protein PPL_04684 [Heterostelium album PN500]|uniref:VWFA domain-containing protein n=1 Tax=Heterostelium pallidum (strain ATCC 26659 / Pp 5 / PN500) TaxID=670386 RepID=D3B893_HETP5|nr:hypothetical protein PPL_04684 [Heterostelium album PN500]EFA82261.1 hypothetical protein PPL_04684 [Heterostelium album PN500]|eukprot:XP_020434378.1 hypothetical protein PPL_04684 [Heterostelium album PN500]
MLNSQVRNSLIFVSSVKDASGAIWVGILLVLTLLYSQTKNKGCVVQPFRNIEQCHGNKFDIDRCKKCFAYVNPYIVREPNNTYKCVLCDTTNKLETDRYLNLAYSHPDQVPELQYNNLVLEDIIDNNNNNSNDNNSDVGVIDQQLLQLQQLEEYKEFANNPIYIAVVDHSGSEDQINTIHDGLEALVHALPDNCLFGMIIYSQKIGIFNFNTTVPSLKYIDVISSSNDDIVFDDILPLTSFLVNKSKFETNILNAINILPQIESTVNKKGAIRALGPTINMLLDYLTFDNIKFNVKVGLFLCGNPVFGDGTVEKEFTTLESLYSSYQEASFLKPSTMFYQRQAERATLLGVHFDMYCIGAKYFGLDSIKFLTTSTGGNLYRYTQIGPKCSLPQDIYKLISNGWGFHGLLRIRTSKNYAVDNCFGNIIPSKNYENLYHIESCSTFTSFGFDFKFTDPSTFEFGRKPYIQIAFSYSYLEPLNSNSNNNNNGVGGGENVDESSSTSGNIRVIKKRLQIYTALLQVASTPVELFHSIDLETTITLLTHKIIRESLEKVFATGVGTETVAPCHLPGALHVRRTQQSGIEIRCTLYEQHQSIDFTHLFDGYLRQDDRILQYVGVGAARSLDQEARKFSDYLVEEDNSQGQSFVTFIRELSLTIHKVLL